MLQLHLCDQQFYSLIRCTLYQRFDSNSNDMEMCFDAIRLSDYYQVPTSAHDTTAQLSYPCSKFGSNPAEQSLKISNAAIKSCVKFGDNHYIRIYIRMN